MPLEEFPEKHEGAVVAAANLAITKAGDGLSTKLALQPIAFVVGDEVTLVLRGKIDDVGHKRDPKAEKERIALGQINDGEVVVSRHHTLTTTAIAIVPDAKVKQVTSILSAEAKETEKLAQERQVELDRLAAEKAERDAQELEEAAGIQRLTDWAGEGEDADLSEDPDEAIADE